LGFRRFPFPFTSVTYLPLKYTNGCFCTFYDAIMNINYVVFQQNCGPARPLLIYN